MTWLARSSLAFPSNLAICEGNLVGMTGQDGSWEMR